MLFTFPSRYWFAIGLSGVFSLAGWARRIRAGFHVSRVTQGTGWPRKSLREWGCHPLRPDFPVRHTSLMRRVAPALQPPACRNMRGLGSSPVARRYWGNHSYFLFLRVLRCFSSPRWPPGVRRDNAPSGHWVVPFGDPRVNGHLRLTAAFRSLSRPSSPPRAKASAMRPSVLPSTSLHKREGSVSRLRFLFFSFCHCRNMS